MKALSALAILCILSSYQSNLAAVEIKTQIDNDFNDKLDGRSPLLRAIRGGDIINVKKILDEGSERLIVTGHMGRGVLHVACNNNDLTMAKFLLAKGAAVDHRRERGDTPLFWCKSAQMTDLLIRNGAKVHTKDFAGREAIHWAAQFSRPSVIQSLVQAGANVNVKDASSRTPLHWAVMEITGTPPLETVMVLLKLQAEVNVIDDYGKSPLHHVVRLPNMQQKLLDGTLKYNPAVPVTTKKILGLLLDSGANADLRKGNGVTARSIADAWAKELILEKAK